ncbi:PfkB family carbohydrate kinase [Streptomyces sp. BI20]|uniref:PfkB family carbohydrate kinase n=1 Tax=Streptomyces sp. BI20 TaxID=3403460 RepID=UPI003C73E01B
MPLPHVAVLGSANVDLVVRTARAPALGETVTGASFTTAPGGKGANQAVAAARAGARVSFTGAVGDDPHGAFLRAALLADGIDLTGLRTLPGTTGTAHVTVDDAGHNAIVVVPGVQAELTALTPADTARITAADTLLLQLEVPLPLVLAAARAARAAGVRTVLTPAPVPGTPPAELFAVTDLLVPNEHEAAALTGRTDPYEAAAALLELVPEVVVTLGAAGSLWRRRGLEPVRVPAPRVRAVDTTAAGDTFVGTLAAGLAAGTPTPAALTRAATAAALAVTRPGAQPSMPNASEVNALLTTD